MTEDFRQVRAAALPARRGPRGAGVARRSAIVVSERSGYFRGAYRRVEAAAAAESSPPRCSVLGTRLSAVAFSQLRDFPWAPTSEGGCFLPHPIGIVLAPQCRIGPRGVSLFSGVVLGINHRSPDRAAPSLGNGRDDLRGREGDRRRHNSAIAFGRRREWPSSHSRCRRPHRCRRHSCRAGCGGRTINGDGLLRNVTRDAHRFSSPAGWASSALPYAVSCGAPRGITSVVLDDESKGRKQSSRRSFRWTAHRADIP